MSTTDARVDQLLPGYPERVTRPVADLLDRGIVDTQTIALVRQMASREGERHRFLYHLLLVDGLRKQGIPIEDTFMMAQEAGRSVNLLWSANRWREEHERLSRLVTMKRLAEANTVYDLAYYQARLPADWPGYLIRTSRRLGMEGLRQRHCIASFDPQIRLGTCAIAVVFIEQQRYTVELRRSVDQPLYIWQAAGRRNRAPDARARKQISELLGVPWYASRRPTSTDLATASTEALRRALTVLRQAGIDEVHVTFDGSGDSGMIEEPAFYRGFESVPNSEIAGLQVPSPAGLEPLGELLDKAFEQFLDSTDVDWYNNDGGYGEFTLKVDTGALEVEINTRYTQTDCTYADEILLEEEDDDTPDVTDAA